jgi:hypothetical protein
MQLSMEAANNKVLLTRFNRLNSACDEDDHSPTQPQLHLIPLMKPFRFFNISLIFP